MALILIRIVWLYVQSHVEERGLCSGVKSGAASRSGTS